MGPPLPTLRLQLIWPQENKLRVVIAPPLDLREAVWRRKRRIRRLLDNHQRVGRKPAAIAQRRERFFRELLAIGRIDKHESERFVRVHRTEPGGIAAENARDAAEAERLHVLPDQRPRFGSVIYEQREGRAARYRLQAERTGAGEEIEDAHAGDRIVVAMRQDVEERFTQAVAGGPYVLRLGRRQRASAEPAADDAHSAIPRRPRAGRSWPRRSRMG